MKSSLQIFRYTIAQYKKAGKFSARCFSAISISKYLNFFFSDLRLHLIRSSSSDYQVLRKGSINRNQVERSAGGKRVMQAILCICTRLYQSARLSLCLSVCLSVRPYVLKNLQSIGTYGQFLSHCPILGKLIPLPSLSSQTQRVFGLVSRQFPLSTILFLIFNTRR